MMNAAMSIITAPPLVAVWCGVVACWSSQNTSTYWKSASTKSFHHPPWWKYFCNGFLRGFSKSTRALRFHGIKRHHPAASKEALENKSRASDTSLDKLSNQFHKLGDKQATLSRIRSFSFTGSR